MFRKLSILFFVLVGSTAGADVTPWDYISDKYGVNAWATNFPKCNGSSQSPIDIKRTVYSNLGDIQFSNYDALPANVNVTAKNNGHTYSISFSGFTDSNSPKISGGGLPGEFKLVGMHFHWGNDNSLGSEHHVNNTAYPAELHAVHLNTKYPNVSVGLDKADGLAVLGVLIQRGQYNQHYNFLDHEKHNVADLDMTSKLNMSSLMGLFPSDKSFYRYNGSLTTPGCQEVVTWTVFTKPVEISDGEFNALRDMKYLDTNNTVQPLVNNHRPIQPQNDRLVLSFNSNPAGAYVPWDYISDKYGVNAWATNFPKCNGNSQSPIDINRTVYSNLGDIQFSNYDALPANVNVTAKNNGHTYSISFSGFTDSNSPKISGGGLPGEFKLVGMHFHWGNDNSLGSEHHVNNTAYPAELHAVHLNTKYPNVSVGLDKADGLAVLGVLIQRGQYNQHYNFLDHEKHNVTYPDMTSKLNMSSLMGLFPSDKSFYRYNGSLTTPGCQEVVTWTVFTKPVEISDGEFNALRDMKYLDTKKEVQPLVNNHRPIQPQNDRLVLSFNSNPVTTTPRTTMKPSTTGSSKIYENHFMLLGSLFLILSTFLEM